MTLKIGIAGTGNVARANYMPCLTAEKDVELGYYNRTPGKAEQFAADFGGRAFPSPGDLAAWEPDAVLVLTRENDRFEAASALLKHRPRRLFFEKPLVARDGQAAVRQQDFLDARSLMRQADACGCETAMVFNYRFFDQVQLAKRIVAERSFGAVVNFTGLVHYACWSHAIDLVHHFAGPVAELSAIESEGTRGGRAEAKDVTAAMRTAGDAAGTLIGTSALDWTFPLFELTLNFEGGRIHLRDLDGDMEVLDHAEGRSELHAIPKDKSRWDQYRASFARSVAAYLQSLRDGKPPPVPGAAGLRELQVEAAIRRSIAAGRPVDLEAELPLDGS